MPNSSTATSVRTPETVNIRPGVAILSLLQHVNYKAWFAMAEFVDNALQSFLEHRDALERVDGRAAKLRVSIDIDVDGKQVTIRDNAAGIQQADFARAFRPAERPPSRNGLNEFGMGMKSAACWFSPRWTVRTSALGEPVERMVSFDIDRIVHDNLEELQVQTRTAPAEHHYTEIVLANLHRPMQTSTLGKIKKHLASIYRIYLRDGSIELHVDQERLAYEDPAILFAPDSWDPGSEAKRWCKHIGLDFGGGLRVFGFAALLAKGDTAGGGFALFRRNRLIQGSGDESYRPQRIFGRPNSFIYQRLFGELHLEGFAVSHTKDGFRWDEHEDIVLEFLKKQLDEEPLPLLRQAETHRMGRRKTGFREVEDSPAAELHGQDKQMALVPKRPSLASVVADVPTWRSIEQPVSMPAEPEPSTQAVATPSPRVIELALDGQRWLIHVDLSNDPAVGEWLSVRDVPDPPSSALEGNDRALGWRSARRVDIRLALAHPFTERFAGAEPSQIEPLIRIAVALGVAEIRAQQGGVKFAGAIRRNVNELLRDSLSKP